MKILGIESSCDETAAAIIEDGQKVLSNVVVSQIDIHAEYGGVIPEIAARSHIEAIAQACGLMCLSATTTDATGGVKSYDTILASVEGAKFRRKIVPGDQMRIETELLQRSRNMGKARGVVTIDGQVATEATLAFLLVPRK